MINEKTSPLPVTLKDIRKYPLASMLFLCLIAISILYARSEKQNTKTIDDLKANNTELKEMLKRHSTEIGFLQEQVRRGDSALADVKATLRTLKEYGKIQ